MSTTTSRPRSWWMTARSRRSSPAMAGPSSCGRGRATDPRSGSRSGRRAGSRSRSSVRASSSRMMVSAGTPPGSVLVLPGDLGGGTGLTTTIGRDTRAGMFTGSFGADPFSGPQPYWGVQPGEGGEPEAYVFAGTRIVPDGERGILAQAAPMALLPGLEPMGRVGEDGAWTALLSNFAQPRLRDSENPACHRPDQCPGHGGAPPCLDRVDARARAWQWTARADVQRGGR